MHFNFTILKGLKISLSVENIEKNIKKRNCKIEGKTSIIAPLIFCGDFSTHNATKGGIYFSACRVSRGFLGGIEKAYMTSVFDTATICIL